MGNCKSHVGTDQRERPAGNCVSEKTLSGRPAVGGFRFFRVPDEEDATVRVDLEDVWLEPRS